MPLRILLIAVLWQGVQSMMACAEPFVPGTGVVVPICGDDFEEPRWQYIKNGSKASYEQDEQQRPPGGKSANGRWYEGAKRGQPDVIRRLPTPPGGLAGSTGSMFVATRFSGIPGASSGKQQQDDLLMGVESRLGRSIPASWSPSVVVRVYLPEFNRWEQRSGASFGVRADIVGRTPDGDTEPYWPGMFIMFRSARSGKYDHDYAQLTIRAQSNGRDVPGPVIEEPGWWTFGLSFTPDGAVHQYASPGVDDLTEEDHLYSSFPYGNRMAGFSNFFINVANRDDGRTWSTPWVIDDPTLYVIPPHGQSLENLVRGRSSFAGRVSPQGRTARDQGRSMR
ncbi:MAG TPA: hypothetical protein VF175_04400 [Lacipirellula sp.]